MKKIVSHIIITLLVAATAIYSITSAWQLLFQCKIANTLICRGLILDQSKIYLFTNSPFNCSSDTIIIAVNSKLMPKNIGTLKYSANKWTYFTSLEIIDPTTDRGMHPFSPWCVGASNHLFSKTRYFQGNDSVDEATLMEGIKFNRPGGDKINDRFVIRLSKIQGYSMLNTRSEGLGVSYPLFSTVDTNYFEVNFGSVPFDTNMISNKLFSFPANFGVEDEKLMVYITSKEGVPFFKVINRSNVTIASDRTSVFKIGNVMFEIKRQYTRWLVLCIIFYIICLIVFQTRLVFKFYVAPDPFFKSIVAFQMGCNSLLFLGMPLFILSMQQDLSRWWIIPLAFTLNLNLYYFFTTLKGVHLIEYFWELSKKHSLFFMSTAFFLGCASLFLASNEAVFGIPILHYGKGLILLLLVLFQSMNTYRDELKRKWLEKNYFLRLFVANLENLTVILFGTFITWITHDIGSLIFTIGAILLISLLNNKKQSFLPGILLLLIIIMVFLGASKMNRSFMNDNRKVYRLVSWVMPPTYFKYANESDRETASDQYYLLKSKWANPQTSFKSTIIPPKWRTVYFTDYAVLWSFLLGGWVFIFLAACTILLLTFHLLRLIFISLKVFKINHFKVFYFPETKSKVVVFLLAITFIQFIYPFFSNFLCLPLTGQSVPALSASKIEVFFLIVLLTALQHIYNHQDYYLKVERFAKRKNLKSYVAIRKQIVSLTVIIAIILFSTNVFRRMVLGTLNNEMSWPIFYSDTLNDTLSYTTAKCDLIKNAQQYIGNDDYTKVPRVKHEYLKNLASLYYYDKPYRKLIYRPPNFNNSLSEILKTISADSAVKLRIIPISENGIFYGYAIRKYNNGKPIEVLTNKYLTGFPITADSINFGLQVSLNKALEEFVTRTGAENVGSIIVSDNLTGTLLVTASYPFFYNSTPAVIEKFNVKNPHNIRLIPIDNTVANVADSYLLPGSLVKPIVAYAGLKNIEGIEELNFNKVNFAEYLMKSDDQYSGELFKRLMANPIALDNAIHDDFDLPLYSPNEDAFIDTWPQSTDFDRELNRMNPIYRLSIGQQQTFSFRKMVEIYSRIMSGHKVTLSYEPKGNLFEPLSIQTSKLNSLRAAMHGAFNGTANGVRLALEEAGIDYSSYICKTGTAQKREGKSNATSSFILCTERYTIGIQLAGDIPENMADLSAKSLFVKLIPLFKNGGVLR